MSLCGSPRRLSQARHLNSPGSRMRKDTFEGAMQIIDHTGQRREQWRPGVLTRMRVSAETGAGSLCVFEQRCDPGCGVPTHVHTVEEILTVLAGQAEVWLGADRATL